MTMGISKMLNLPPLDEVLKQQGIEIDLLSEEAAPEVASEEDINKALAALQDLSARVKMAEGTDHTEAMDELHDEILQHARDLMSYGFNIDMPRQRGIFEIASIMYGHAINTTNLKRDAQLKAMKLMLDRRKVDMDERKTNHLLGQSNQAATTDDNGTIVVEDRNDLIRRLREQMKSRE